MPTTERGAVGSAFFTLLGLYRFSQKLEREITVHSVEYATAVSSFSHGETGELAGSDCALGGTDTPLPTTTTLYSPREMTMRRIFGSAALVAMASGLGLPPGNFLTRRAALATAGLVASPVSAAEQKSRDDVWASVLKNELLTLLCLSQGGIGASSVRPFPGVFW